MQSLMTDIMPMLPPGFTSRGATMADLEAAVELMDTCALAMLGHPELTLEAVRQEWEMPGLNLGTDMHLVLNPEGQFVGYIEVWTLQRPAVSPWVWGRVHPDYENLGIGSYLLHWAENRALKVLSDLPPELRVSFRCGTVSTHTPAHRLFEGYGMQPLRYSYRMGIEMTEAPPAPILPEGITIRLYDDARDSRAVYEAIQDSFRDHWGFVAPENPEDGYARWRHMAVQGDKFDPSLWFLAMDGDEIAAITLCRPSLPEDRQMGYIDTVGVRRAWRRQGLGLALLHTAFGEFWRRGTRKVSLDVDASSLTGATRLYERAGMAVQRRFDTYEKELRPGVDIATQSL